MISFKNGLECLLRNGVESDRKIEIAAMLENAIVGTAEIRAVGSNYKVRAEFGVRIARKCWDLGLDGP